MDIIVNVINQKLKIETNLKCLVAGTQEFIRFVFRLPDEWKSLSPFAQFAQNGVGYNVYLDEDWSCCLPSEITDGTCTLMLYGSAGTVKGTTNALTLTIDQNHLIADAQSTEISQSLYDQLVAQVSLVSGRINQIIDISTSGDSSAAEVVDIRTGYDGTVYESAGDAVRAIAAEVVDIRTGDDGTVYNSAGDAVRGHMATANALINSAVSPVEYTVTTRGYVNATSGAIASSSNWQYTNYINVSPYDKIVFTCPVANGSTTLASVAAIAFYSSPADSGFLETVPLISGSTNGYELRTADIPSGAQYARASIWWSNTLGTYFLRPVSDVATGVKSAKQIALSSFGTNAASGSIASFTDGANDVPVKALSVSIDPVQSGSGDPSPENVRPITGWTGAEIHRTGKNLADYATTHTTNASATTVTILQEQEGFRFIGSSGTYRAARIDVPLKTGVRYTLSTDAEVSDGLAFIGFRRKSDNRLMNYSTKITESGHLSLSYTPTEDNSLYLCFFGTDNNAATCDVTYSNVQLEIGSSETSYEPYQGDTYAIDWTTEAGTVYGGTLDVTTGVLAVDKGGVDMGTLAWTYNSANSFFQVQKSALTPVCRAVNSAQLMCSVYKNNGSTAGTDKTIWQTANSIRVMDTDYTTVDAFVAAVNGERMAYELETPLTYQLSPVEVTTLLGENHIWADTGDVDVTYRADTKLYIDTLTNPDNDMIADSNILSGKYFVVGNKLYLSTAAISAGETIVPGTNCTQTNLAEALNALMQ